MTQKIIFFFLSHPISDSLCECGDDWLRPLLQRIKDEPKSFVVPIIDVIEVFCQQSRQLWELQMILAHLWFVAATALTSRLHIRNVSLKRMREKKINFFGHFFFF